MDIRKSPDGDFGKIRKSETWRLPVLVMVLGSLLTGLSFWWARADSLHDLERDFQLYATERFGIIKDELEHSLNHIGRTPGDGGG